MSSFAQSEQATVSPPPPSDEPSKFATCESELNTNGDPDSANANSVSDSEKVEHLLSINDVMHNEETEDDILNRIDSEATVTEDNLDSLAEDSILNDSGEKQQTEDESAIEAFKSLYEEDLSENIEDKSAAVSELGFEDELQKSTNMETKLNDDDALMEEVDEDALMEEADEDFLMEEVDASTSNDNVEPREEEEEVRHAHAKKSTVPLPIEEPPIENDEPDSQEPAVPLPIEENSSENDELNTEEPAVPQPMKEEPIENDEPNTEEPAVPQPMKEEPIENEEPNTEKPAVPQLKRTELIEDNEPITEEPAVSLPIENEPSENDEPTEEPAVPLPFEEKTPDNHESDSEEPTDNHESVTEEPTDNHESDTEEPTVPQPIKEEPIETDECDIEEPTVPLPFEEKPPENHESDSEEPTDNHESDTEEPTDNHESDTEEPTVPLPIKEEPIETDDHDIEEPTVPLPIKGEPIENDELNTEELSVPLPMKEEPMNDVEPDTEECDKSSPDESREDLSEKTETTALSKRLINDAIFKAPDEVSNDKSMDDESELLDISMIRESKEDDACAIADANEMEDKDTQRCHEDQGEKAETEQENSDGDGAAQDDDATNGLEAVEEDSRMDTEDNNKKNNEASKDHSDDSNEAREVDEELNEEPNKENNLGDHSKPKDTNMTNKEKEGDMEIDEDRNFADKRKPKRPLVTNDTNEFNAKKPKLRNKPTKKKLPQKPHNDVAKPQKDVAQPLNDVARPQNDVAQPQNEVAQPQMKRASRASSEATPSGTEGVPELQTLKSFANYMQCRKISKKLTRSDLEELVIQKICEVLVLKSSQGELHQTIKQQEQNLAILNKEVQQLSKQCKDLLVVHKKVLAEFKTHKETGRQQPLVPLKITRSVGLQVRLMTGNDASKNRKNQQVSNGQQKTVLSTVARQIAQKVGQQPSGANQQVRSPQKPQPITKVSQTISAPILTQALHQRSNVVAKKTTPNPIQKPAEDTKKPATHGVIDLTDEDDRLKPKSATNGIKFRTVPAATNRVPIKSNKTSPAGGKSLLNQTKPGNKPNAVPQALRLTQVNSGLHSTTTNSPQMLYVVPTITTNAGGQQKVAIVNFQPTNSMINGSPVSVINEAAKSLTIKNVPSTTTVSSTNRPKHPAPLPAPPALRFNLAPDSKLTLPKPILTIKKLDNGLILQWKMPYNLDLYATIASYQLYAYQETTALPNSSMWRKVGDVKALALPMACTLTQFSDKNKYYFAVRAVDVLQRIGAFSDPQEISL